MNERLLYGKGGPHHADLADVATTMARRLIAQEIRAERDRVTDEIRDLPPEWVGALLLGYDHATAIAQGPA